MLNSRTLPTTKKILAGSCDKCRKKRGDSATTQDNIGVASNAECTHADLIKDRLHSFPGLMSRADPLPAAQSSKRSGRKTSPQGVSISSTCQQVIQSSENTELKEDFSHPDLLESLKRLSLRHFENFSQRYYGRSSSFSLFTGVVSITKKSAGNENMVQFREHFDLQPWERATADAEIPHYIYPGNDLILSLVAIYFETINPIIPILHRLTFEKNIDEGLHLRDYNFGASLLLVLAVASLYSDDLRVLADPCSKLSSGWRFFEQVHIFKLVICAPPCLYELQLGGIYAMGTSVPEFGWTMIEVGLRSAIDIGLHRRKPEDYKFTVEDELKKRSFWALIVLDRLVRLYVGYPAMIQDEELDLQTPIECNDEYWEIAPDGRVHFNQPPGEPSKISYFNASIKLSEIMSVVMKTLCSLKKPRDMLGLTGKSWEQWLVADLDSSLNAWVDSVPDHLRWNPRNDKRTFLYQSASLYNSPLSMPFLVICTNAARSCSQILKVHMTRMRTINPQIIVGAFTSGAVFATNIWSHKRAGRAPNAKDVAGFQVCLATFEDAADTWNIVGRSLIPFRAIASVESPPPRRHVNVTVTPAPSTWSSYDAMPHTALLQSVQPFCEQTPYLDDYLASRMCAGFPLPVEPFLEVSSPVQPSYVTPESGLSGELYIDMWTDAPLGFSFSEWDAYVTSLAPGANERP
ncbi:fungal-specific transcription factor domain-containing protein [Armillaria nabsnona]|nr:fungal-specific transcription factor domain-containing protein [Armillaria nabsnona]